MQPRVKKFIQKCCLIPQRYIFAIMGFLAMTFAFQSRVCLSVAITEMVVYSDDDYDSSYNDPDACPSDVTTENVTSSHNSTNSDLFDWDEPTQGLILSSFFYGYIITQVPGGLLADKFGGKHVLGFGMLGSAVFSILTPTAAKTGVGWLIAALVLKGLIEGITYPAINALLARWIPLQERGSLGTFVYSGADIGAITGVLLSGYLLHTYKGNWPLVFYVFGGIGLVWFVLWMILCYSTPETHPFITDKEKLFLQEAVGERKKDTPPAPWKHIFTSLPMWANIASEFGWNWAYVTVLTELPKYMKEVLKYSIDANGVLSSIPYAAMWLASLGAGWIADRMIEKKWLSVTATRKIMTTFAHLGAPAGLIAASYAGCDRTVVVILFTVAMGFSGFYYPGMGVNVLDLSPNYAATIMALVIGAGDLTGIIVPYVVGVLTPNHTLLEWRSVIWISVGVNLFTLIIVLWGASGEVQPWDDMKAMNLEKEETEKRDSATNANNIIEVIKLNNVISQ